MHPGTRTQASRRGRTQRQEQAVASAAAVDGDRQRSEPVGRSCSTGTAPATYATSVAGRRQERSTWGLASAVPDDAPNLHRACSRHQGPRKPSQKLEWAEDGQEDVLPHRRGEHEPPEAHRVADCPQRNGTQSAGSTGGMWPRKAGATRVANAPAGRASISGRSWSKASSKHTLGAI